MSPNHTGFILYELKRGDTLYNLARQYQVSVNDIINANPHINPDYLRAGDIIHIPKYETYSDAKMLHDIWRALWEQHVEWTRMVILSDVFNTPDLSDNINRLLRNPTDMAAVIRRYYGDANANHFESLIHDHLTIALDLVNAAKAGNSDAAARIERRWYANAENIAAFLSSLNPYWPYQTLLAMLNTHLGLTKDEAVAVINKNYPESIRLYDSVEKQAMEMADALTDGIAKQFNL